MLLHVSLILAYGAAAVAVALYAPEDRVGAPVLAGLCLFALCALAHEILSRRAADARATRHMLALKRAYDLSKVDLEAARAEMAQLYRLYEVGAIPAPGRRGEANQTAAAPEPPRPEPPTPIQTVPVLANPDPAPNTVPMPERAPGNSVWGLSAALAAAERQPVLQRTEPDASPGPVLGPPPTPPLNEPEAEAATEDAATAEVAVMHALLEKLYADPPAAVDGDGAEPGAQADPDTPDMLAVVREALKENRVDLYVQPIVSLPQRKRRFYECSGRIRNAAGDGIAPDAYREIAQEAGLLAAVDNILLFRCIQLLRKARAQDSATLFFCNISAHTLADRAFLQDFIDYMERHAELSPNLVLEFSQHDLENALPAIEEDLGRLGALGYRFSLDGVHDTALDIDLLTHNQFQYVKVDGGLVMDKLAGGAAADIRVLKQQLDAARIDLIIEEIETEKMLIELLDFNIDYGQGHLFGPPRLSKSPIAKPR